MALPQGIGRSKKRPSSPPDTPLPSGSGSAGGWAGLRVLRKVLDKSAGAIGPLKDVVNELMECIEIYNNVAKGSDEFKALQGDLEAIFETLQQQLSGDIPPTMTASMENLCSSILRELKYVKEKQGRGTTQRHLEARQDADDILACYRRIQRHLQRLSLNANLSMWKVMDEQTTNANLDRLCPSLSACYNSKQAKGLKRGGCTPGTRVDVLGQTYGWAHNRATESVYWLNGMAGTGKTTIAYSLCQELDATHNLGASFFCSRLLPECRDVNQIVPSIAYQLARFSRPFRSALSKVLDKERDAHTQLLEIQFEVLIIKPLIEVRDTLPEDLVVVVDALDECEDKGSTRDILDALLTKTSELPIKVFIASRPEPEIRDQLKQQGNRWPISRLVLHELDRDIVQGDIRTYLNASLGPIEPSESDIDQLVERAGILFIYAATVVRYIGYDNFSKNPRKRLMNVLDVSRLGGNNLYKGIDELYALILDAALDDPGLDDEEKDDTKQVLYATLCAREPLTIRALSGLLDLHDVERVRAALRPLWSVLHVVESSELVATLHASFPDYMFDPNRSRSHYCDRAMQEHILTRHCLHRIKNAKPQFNICGQESSYVPDELIPNLEERVEMAISPELPYACRHWATHLEHANKPSDLIELVEDFMSARLLLWMEIMNLNKCMDIGVGVLFQAEEWCMRQACSEELKQLTHDAWRFVAVFTSSPVSQSTPHIYVSMLPFWPISAPISRHYATRAPLPMVPQGSAIDQQQLELLARWSVDGGAKQVTWSSDGTRIGLVVGGKALLLNAATGRALIKQLKPKSSPVQSLGFSPGNSRIAYGANDGTIGVWDARSGDIVLGPLKGHTGCVKSIAFSPNGTRIISSSSFGDNTICMWDAQNGEMVLGPLQGHTDSIRSVAFSPDGALFASGSNDKTIRMWDSRSGQMVLSPLEGHTGRVTSVAFSPDGTRVVSGSDDRTLRMWDVQNRQMVLSPLLAHSSSVTTVAFSPDGSRVVSGSWDRTICIWDARNGQAVLRLSTGRDGWVNSVAYSPDGTRIISSSNDSSISVWDARGQRRDFSSVEGNTAPVCSVSFSPDGTRIASCSSDYNMRLWDARTGRMVLGPIKGQSDRFKLVTFSPDGTRIASGSLTGILQVWDARSGQTMLGPLKGHTSSVSSVAFSLDGTHIVSGSFDKTIRVHDARSGQMALSPLEGHTRSVTSVAFSPDGTRIVSGSDDNTVRLWDARSGKMVHGPLRGHTSSVASVTFSPDGTRIASGSHDATVRLWDARSGQSLLHLMGGHIGGIKSVAFSPDSNHIVSGSFDLTIRLWDARSGKMVLRPLEAHTGHVTSVAFSLDGSRIVSGSRDKTIRVWDARIAQTVTSIAPSSTFGHPRPKSWKIATDGWVVDGENETKLLVWVPPHLRPCLLSPGQILLISSTHQSVSLNFFDSKIGESWAECYQP